MTTARTARRRVRQPVGFEGGAPTRDGVPAESVPLALDDAPDALVVLSPIRDAAGGILDFRIEYANRAWRTLFGHAHADLAGRRVYEALPATAARRTMHATVMETGEPAVGTLELSGSVLEYRVARSAGSLVASLRDISERVLAVKALRASEERYRTLVEGLDAIVFVDDAEAGTSWVSAQAERIMGYPPAQLAEPGFWRSLVVSEDRARTVALWDHDEHLDEYDLEYRVRRADGATIWIHDRMKCVRGVNGKVLRWYGLSFDVTDLRTLRQQAIHSERLEAIGQFASGVAHDFSDVLLGIALYSGFVRDSLPDGDPRAQDLDQVQATVERGRGLVSQLLAFARGQDVAMAPIDPALIAREVAPIVQRLVGPTIEVRVTADRDPGLVLGDRTQYEQILFNLASNAARAMPDGGRLEIEVTEGNAPRGRGGSGWVRIVVRDTGVGMSAETVARVFEPFFTTAERGYGTGLGLTIVHSIVRSFAGTIDVTSAPGAGTTFEILLPRMTEESPSEPIRETPPEGRRVRRRTRRPGDAAGAR